MVATTQVGPEDRGRKKSKKRNEFDFDLIWIEMSFQKQIFSRNEFARPVMGTIFLVYCKRGADQGFKLGVSS